MMKYTILILFCTVFMIITTICHGKEARKILGGQLAVLGEFPYQVSLQYAGHHICGGSIITDYHILISASCVLFGLIQIAGNLRVLMGTNDKYNTLGIGTYHNVKYVIYHPDYKPRLFWINDIAILQLETQITLNILTIRKINLPRFPRLPKTIVKSCGWGDDSFEIHDSMRYLQKIEMKIEGSRVCENYLLDYSTYRGGHQSCATSTNPTTVMTLGDGGGGLIRDGEIIGVISVIFQNQINTILFTKIFPFYREWIEQVIESYS